MIETWERSGGDEGSAGWNRIIAQAGPELTWEWHMVDETAPYARLIPGHVRQRVHSALERDAGTAEWRRVRTETQQADQERAERIARLCEPYRSGQASRLAMPELDNSLQRHACRNG